MASASSYLSKIIEAVNGLTIQSKGIELLNALKKKDPTMCYLQETLALRTLMGSK